MDELLEQLNQVHGVAGSLLINEEGLVLAAALRSDIDPDASGMAVGEAIAAAQQCCARLQLQQPAYLHAHGAESGMMVLQAGKAYLAIATDPNANLALLRLETQPFASAISDRLSL